MDKYGLYLNCKTFNKGDNIIYDYISDDVNKVNFFLKILVILLKPKTVH